MKKILTIFILLTAFDCIAQIANFSHSLKIEHTYGDESYAVEEIIFENIEGKVYGKISIPDTNTLLSSKTLLNNSDIEILNTFLKLAKNYKNDCFEEFSSSYVQYYTIKIDDEEIVIRKSCDWRDHTFFDLKKNIFKKYLSELENKKNELNIKFSNLLVGKWKENLQIDKLPIDSIALLEKVMKVENQAEGYLEFKHNRKAIIHRGNKKVYYEYRIDKLSAKEYLWLLGENNENTKEFIYSHRYQIISLSKTEMKLIRS